MLKSIVIKVFLALLAVSVFILISICIMGCLSMPKCEDGIPPSCCAAYKICYLSQKAADKSVCSNVARECFKTLRWEYCGDAKHIPAGKTFDNCWDKLD